MKKSYLCIFSILFTLQFSFSQTTFSADKLLSSILAPDNDANVHTNCSHNGFGGHVNEVFSEELNNTVFKFQTHQDSSDESCKNFGTKYNEIKVATDAPEALLGTEGETVVYTWKFKIDENFNPSNHSIDLHQLKAVGGSEADIPLFTLTTAKSKTEHLELRYAEMDEQITLASLDLNTLKGVWFEVYESITYNEIGAYAITIKKASTDEVLLDYNKEAIRTWKTDAEFIRPKWGIHHSVNSIDTPLNLTVYFANFNIEENNAISKFQSSLDQDDITVFPNPASSKINIKGSTISNYDNIALHDSFGREIQLKYPIVNNSVNISYLKNGIYFVVFKKDKEIKVVKKILKF